MGRSESHLLEKLIHSQCLPSNIEGKFLILRK